MLYREIIAVCSQIHTKHINTLCGQNMELLNTNPRVCVRCYTVWAGQCIRCYAPYCVLGVIFRMLTGVQGVMSRMVTNVQCEVLCSFC
jgi:hypothetical protein